MAKVKTAELHTLIIDFDYETICYGIVAQAYRGRKVNDIVLGRIETKRLLGLQVRCRSIFLFNGYIFSMDIYLVNHYGFDDTFSLGCP
jgi:hypothetical protein